MTDPFVSFLAGPIEPSSLLANPDLGQQVTMGPCLYFNIKPEIARQWIETLTPIANEGINE